MFNLPESKKQTGEDRSANDFLRCQDIIKKDVCVRDLFIEKTVRLGKYKKKSRPIIIELKDEKTKWAVVGKAKNLKDSSDETRKSVS